MNPKTKLFLLHMAAGFAGALLALIVFTLVMKQFEKTPDAVPKKKKPVDPDPDTDEYDLNRDRPGKKRDSPGEKRESPASREPAATSEPDAEPLETEREPIPLRKNALPMDKGINWHSSDEMKEKTNLVK